MLALQNLLGLFKRLRYLCQDETRVGLKSETGKVLTARGIKPVAPVQWGRDNFWIYGVVEPLSGWHEEQEYDHLNSKQFQSFLDALSQALGEDMALIQLDQAKAHQALSLKWGTKIRYKLDIPFERIGLRRGMSVLYGDVQFVQVSC